MESHNPILSPDFPERALQQCLKVSDFPDGALQHCLKVSDVPGRVLQHCLEVSDVPKGLYSTVWRFREIPVLFGNLLEVLYENRQTPIE